MPLTSFRLCYTRLSIVFTPNDKVKDWKDLQTQVAQLFVELGFTVHTPYVAELAGRGRKEVDVYAEDRKASSATVYIFECKWWNSEVPQDVVHAFHTVVQGCGANTGFIISKRAFQKGAKEAVQYSNINLLTFEELQHKFGPEWFRIKQSELREACAPVSEVTRLHFDQQSVLPVTNNIIFHTPELYERLCILCVAAMHLIIQCASKWPESYLGPEPVRMAINPNNPSEPHNGWYTVPTVRQYFKEMIAALHSWTTQFTELRNEAKSSFDHLDATEQERLMSQSLSGVVEETPVRVLKDRLPPEEYQRILKILSPR